MNRFYKGTGVALVTPFHEDGSLDLNSLEKIVQHVIKGGVEYLVPLGTTGETATLSPEEKKEMLECVIRVNAGRLPVVLGLGGNNTMELVAQLKKNDLRGVDAILSVGPYYNKPSQKGVYEHYKAIASATSLPIVLYNVPGRTMNNILPETVLQLAKDVKNIVAVKEASGSVDQAMRIIGKQPADFMTLSGDDMLTLPCMAAGAEGVISVVANIFPKEFSNLVREGLNGNFKRAKELHYSLYDFTNLLFEEGNPAGIKAALSILGLCKNSLRLPLVPVSERLRKSMEKQLDQMHTFSELK